MNLFKVNNKNRNDLGPIEAPFFSPQNCRGLDLQRAIYSTWWLTTPEVHLEALKNCLCSTSQPIKSGGRSENVVPRPAASMLPQSLLGM